MPAGAEARVTELEAELTRLRRLLLLRETEAVARKAAMAQYVAGGLTSRLTAVSETGCAYGSICVQIADLLILIAALPPAELHGAHGPDR